MNRQIFLFRLPFECTALDQQKSNDTNQRERADREEENRSRGNEWQEAQNWQLFKNETAILNTVIDDAISSMCSTFNRLLRRCRATGIAALRCDAERETQSSEHFHMSFSIFVFAL